MLLGKPRPGGRIMSETFRAARDFLLAKRTDYEVAYSGFQWPRLDRFNWALDWFDKIGAGERGDQAALWVIFEDGTENKVSFRELSHQSSQLANYYRELGVRRGDRVLVMLGNVVPLWNTVLALIKLGAVIVPTTPLLGENDLAERLERGRIGHIVSAADGASRFGHLGKQCTRIVVGGSIPGWHAYEEHSEASAKFKPDGETR
ncbi:MAG: acetyl-CoA synthetase, partial [Verrucomicrobiota bacterium]|nr:acetyl-CoA synthetase [Verrucomicrobiota bacterium]